VAVEEPAIPIEQVVQAAAAQTFFGPGRLLPRAAPGLVDEDRETPLQESTVEGGIVGDDENGLGCQSGDRIVVEHLAVDIGIGDASEANDRLRQRCIGILEPGIALVDGVEPAVGREVEGQDGELDDLVPLRIEACRLDVDDEAAAQLDAGGRLCIARHRRHTSQDPEVTGLFETFR
jgi:hypothetical protein